MSSKFFVGVLAVACLVELITACAPSSSPDGTTRTTPAPGRKRRQVGQTSVQLNSNVAIGDSGRLIEKLKAVAANSDIDVAKYGEVDHQLSSSPEGNAVLTLVIGNDVDCGDLRQTTQNIVNQVDEVTSAKINCDGTQLDV